MENTEPTDGSAPPDTQPRVRISSPADALAIVPHLLGFHPANSLVVIGAGRPRDRIELAFRYDLPDPPDSDKAADIAAHSLAVLDRRQLTTVIGIGYGPAGWSPRSPMYWPLGCARPDYGPAS